MTSSQKKLLVVFLVAFVIFVTMVLNGYDLLGPIIALALTIFGINRHYFAKCKHCQSWRTHTQVIEAYEGGPGVIRRCSKCGYASVITGSVMFAGCSKKEQ